MIIYKDILTGDEIISDTFKLTEIDGIVWEADCAMKIIEGGVSVNIDDEGEEVDDEDSVKVNNIVYAFRLQPMSFDKKTYLAYLKGYLKAVKADLLKRNTPRDEITAFEKGAQAYVKNKILPNFDNFEFYTGESMNPDGLIVLLSHREDDTPYVIVWKHGCTEMLV